MENTENKDTIENTGVVPKDKGVLPSRCWWPMGLRGIFAIMFGVIAILWPGLTVTTLIIFFGAYILVDGVFTLTAAFMHRDWPRWWAFLFEGLTGIIAGLIAFLWPGITAVAVLFIIAFWTFLTGVFEIIASLHLTSEVPGKWGLFLAGILSVIVGILIFVQPQVFAVIIVWMIGFYAIVFGAGLLFLAHSLKCAL